MIYLELLWSFIQIGLFSIGGGYAAMPLIQHQVVDLHPWLTMTQFADVIAIAEMTPGPIALNAATFVGIQVAGLPGRPGGHGGGVLPSCVIVLLLAFLYYKFKGFSVIQGILAGVRPAVVAMIASAGVSMVLLAVYGTRTLPADPTAVQWDGGGHPGRGAGGAAEVEGESGLGDPRLGPCGNPSGNFVRGEGGWRFVRGGSVRGCQRFCLV